jgi:type IX secretion system PorP/SprF family membrane protein
MIRIFSTLFLLIACSFSSFLYAQQDAQYTQYMFNSLVINPAYAGTRDAVSLTALYRHQWTGFDGAPRTFSASIHSPVGDKMGLGFFMEADKIGVHNRVSAYGSYAYRIPTSEKTQLSIGLDAGILYYTSNWADAPNPIDPSDPQLANTVSNVIPNFGLGAYWYGDRHFIGFSVPHLLNNRLDDNDVLNYVSKYDMHYFLTAGYVFDMGESVKFKPTVLLKSVPSKAPLEADVNLNFLFKEAFWLGVGYHTGSGIAAILQYEFANNLRLGYAYDFNLSKLSNTNSGSHEIMLGWDFARAKKATKDKGKVLSPRYF